MKQTLSVLNGHRIHIRLTDIKYVEGQGNYSILHLTNRKPIILSRTLIKLEDELSAFIRIHKGYLVNPRFIAPNQMLSKTKLSVTLTTGEVLLVARRRVAHIGSLVA